jgi:hypothetical protein
MKCYTGPRNWTDSLERPRQQKMDIRFGSWKVKGLCRSGSMKTVIKLTVVIMEKYLSYQLRTKFYPVFFCPG